MTVVETQPFKARANGRLTEDEVEAVITTLAKDPTRGALMKGTGGVRKLRVAIGGRGKSGGARVIYYFYDRSMPVFLLSVYAKNEQDNLSKATRNEMAQVVRSIVESYGGRSP